MVAMTIRELMTYMAALPAETYFPVGIGTPFIVGNNTDQVIFRPRIGQTAEQMYQTLDAILGTELSTTTGGRAVISADHCYAYLGFDPESTKTALNLIVLTFMRAMERATKTIRVGLANNTSLPHAGGSFTVPAIWWNSLSKRHQTQMAAEYITARALSGMSFTATDTAATTTQPTTVPVTTTEPTVTAPVTQPVVQPATQPVAPAQPIAQPTPVRTGTPASGEWVDEERQLREIAAHGQNVPYVNADNVRTDIKPDNAYTVIKPRMKNNAIVPGTPVKPKVVESTIGYTTTPDRPNINVPFDQRDAHAGRVGTTTPTTTNPQPIQPTGTTQPVTQPVQPEPRPGAADIDTADEYIVIEDIFGKDLMLVRGKEINTVADPELGELTEILGARDIHYITEN